MEFLPKLRVQDADLGQQAPRGQVREGGQLGKPSESLSIHINFYIIKIPVTFGRRRGEEEEKGRKRRVVGYKHIKSFESVAVQT